MTLTAPELTHLLILMGDTERGTIIRPGAFTAQDALALREKLVLMLPLTTERDDGHQGRNRA